MDLRILHHSDSHSELEQNCPPPDVSSLSLSPRKTPELGHENDSYPFRESYQPWRCNLPSQQRSPRTPNFIKVASELDIARPSKADMNGINKDSLRGLIEDTPSDNGIDNSFYASLSHETPANTGDAGLIRDGFFTARRQTMDSSFGLGTAESSRRPDDSCSPNNDGSSSLFVRAIDRSLSVEQIRKLFSQYGVVQSCEITRSATGYVKMGSPEQAKAARAGLDSDADLHRERRLRVMQRPKSCLSTPQRARSSRKTVRFVTEFLSQGGGDMETRSFAQSGGGNHEGDSHSRNDGNGGGHPHSVTKRSDSFFGGGRLGHHHQKRNPMTNSGNRKVVGRAGVKNIIDDRNRGSTITTDTGDMVSPFAKKTDHHCPSSRLRPKKPKQSPPASPPPSSGLQTSRLFF